jgi:hypothetical protein
MEMGIIIDQCRKERPWDKAKSKRLDADRGKKVG